MSDKLTKKDWAWGMSLVVVVGIITAVAITFSFDYGKPTASATVKSVCRDEIMAIAPDGESVLKLPEGWKYLDNMDGLILVQREVCE